MGAMGVESPPGNLLTQCKFINTGAATSAQ